LSATLGERRRASDQHRGAEQAADRGEHQPGAERDLAWPFFVIA
jgi:hypothetical protein